MSVGKDVTLFIGEGPVYLADGTSNDDAVGLLIEKARVGIVKESCK